MDSDEIGVVLARASELHAKISEAIERALKSEFLLSTSGKSLDSSDHGGDDFDDGYDSYDRGGDLNALVSEGNAEARSLGLIRDALETLEEQLEALQVSSGSLRCPFFLCMLLFLFWEESGLLFQDVEVTMDGKIPSPGLEQTVVDWYRLFLMPLG